MLLRSFDNPSVWKHGGMELQPSVVPHMTMCDPGMLVVIGIRMSVDHRSFSLGGYDQFGCVGEWDGQCQMRRKSSR